MECQEVRQYLGRYLDSALDDEQSLGVETHLNECDACWQELTAMRDLTLDLEDPGLQRMVLTDPTPLPTDFTDRVMERVMAERPHGVNVVWPWLRQKWSRRQYASVAYAMSATLMVVSAGELLFLWNQTTDKLGVMAVQGQAYWEAIQAYAGSAGEYLASFWQWLAGLF